MPEFLLHIPRFYVVQELAAQWLSRSWEGRVVRPAPLKFCTALEKFKIYIPLYI
jgi:hypothetical protein